MRVRNAMKLRKLVLASWSLAVLIVGVLVWKLATIPEPRPEPRESAAPVNLANEGQAAAANVADEGQSAQAVTVEPVFVKKGQEQPPPRTTTLEDVFRHGDRVNIGKISII